MPWHFIDTGLTADYLREENERAYRGELTLDCREEGCQECGICSELGVELELRGGS